MEPSNRSGKKVIYISEAVGDTFMKEAPLATMNCPLFEWSEEKWMDTRDPGAAAIAEMSLNQAQFRGFYGTKPDDYKKWIGKEARRIGLEKDVGRIASLVNYFDKSTTQEELQAEYERGKLHPLLDKTKTPLGVEHENFKRAGSTKEASVFNVPTELQGFSKLIKLWDVDEWRIVC